MPARLSKSRIMSSLQCRKRVHLEINQPQLASYSKSAEAAFAIGHKVGAVATQIFGGESGVMVEYPGGSLAGALALTGQLMASLMRTPIFEATLEHDAVLVREDVLLPVEVEGSPSWDIVEVKASTSLKPEHVHDCAIQAWVHAGAGHPINRFSLAHVDNRFVYPGGGDYAGLLLAEDITDQVLELQPSVPIWVEQAREAASGPMPEVPVGAHCTSPYECPFIHFCWPNDSDYPIRGLGGGGKRLGEWVRAGYRDIRDVPASEVTSEQQLRILRVTRSGQAELLPGAGDFVRALAYPRFYLDFETISPAVPVWAGTRPYQLLPFQWSLHIEGPDGGIEHAEFLDLSGNPPMRDLAEALISAVGIHGPILTYSNFEARVLRELMALVPGLSAALEAILSRLVDLHPVARANYYHPDMLGSWSIKAVLPTIAQDMDYAGLEGIQEGTEASDAYLEAIAADTEPGRREELRAQLLRYCRHDTEAMVRLAHFFAES